MGIAALLTRFSRGLFKEHRQIRRALDDLHNVTSATEAHEQLSRLLTLLERHFNDEEAEEGLHGMIANRAPALTDQLDTCFAQHSAMLYQLRALLTEARGCGRTGLPMLKLELSKMAEALRQHEEFENALLRAALRGQRFNAGKAKPA